MNLSADKVIMVGGGAVAEAIPGGLPAQNYPLTMVTKTGQRLDPNQDKASVDDAATLIEEHSAKDALQPTNAAIHETTEAGILGLSSRG